MSVPVHTVDRLKSYSVRPDQFPEGGQRDVVPRLQHTVFEVLGVAGPTALPIADPLDHPRPHNLDEVEVGTVGGPCGEAVELARLLGELRLAVLLAPVVVCLRVDKGNNVILVVVRRRVPHDLHIVVRVGLTDAVIVMGGGVVLDDVLDALTGEGWVKGVSVDLQGLGGILHPVRRLEVLALGQAGTAFIVPFFDIGIIRLELVGVFRNAVRKAEVVAVANVVVLRHAASHRYPKNNAVGLEKRPDAKVLGVAKEHLVVFRCPGDAGRFPPPADAAPKINAPFDASFFAFVTFDLNGCKCGEIYNAIIIKAGKQFNNKQASKQVT